MQEKHKRPSILGFYTLLMESLDKIDRLNDALPVSMIIDEDEQYVTECYRLLIALRTQFERVRKRITAITFGSDRQYPALQMADMLAYESRSLMVQRIANKDAPPSKLYKQLTKGGIHQVKLWTASDLEEAVKLGTY